MKSKDYSPTQLFNIVFGSVLFAAGVNLFIVPLNLYNGGAIGIAQIIRTLLSTFLGINFSFDIAGILNFCINLPLFILTYQKLSHKFLYGTLLSVVVQTIAFSIIPIPSEPLLDMIASIGIGGIVTGYGIGIVLKSYACGGGLDIIGIYATLHWENFSVGKIAVIINTVIFIACALLFNFETAVYSILYNGIFSFVLDKVHVQNIDDNMMIFTKNPDVKKMIMEKYGRGVTYWVGQGAYTNTDTEVLVTICNKFEVNRIKKDVLLLDPKAFITVSEGLQVTGGYEKRIY